MRRRNKLLMLAARRSEKLSPPIDAYFLREHEVTSDEVASLSNDAAVALAAYASMEKLDPDLHAQLILVGAMALTGIPESIARTALDNLKMTQIAKKVAGI